MSEEPTLIGAWARRLFLGQKCCMVCGTPFKPKNGVGTGARNLGGKELLVCSEKCRDLFLNPPGDSAETEAED